MFARYLLPLCLFVLFVVVVNADDTVVETQDNTVDLSERANPAVKAVAKIIGKLFATATASCLLEASKHCKSHWKHPKAAIECGKNYLKVNKGRCAVGK